MEQTGISAGVAARVVDVMADRDRRRLVTDGRDATAVDQGASL